MRKVASVLRLARKATYVPVLVRYEAAAVRIALFETSADVTGTVIPPRLSLLSKYALLSLPSATTRRDGFAPGTSTSNGPELPRSRLLVSRLGQLVGAQ